MEKTIKELLMEMSEEEIISLLFEPKKYRPIWRFMQTIAGKKAIPDYGDLKWCPCVASRTLAGKRHLR